MSNADQRVQAAWCDMALAVAAYIRARAGQTSARPEILVRHEIIVAETALVEAFARLELAREHKAIPAPAKPRVDRPIEITPLLPEAQALINSLNKFADGNDHDRPIP